MEGALQAVAREEEEFLILCNGDDYLQCAGVDGQLFVESRVWFSDGDYVHLRLRPEPGEQGVEVEKALPLFLSFVEHGEVSFEGLPHDDVSAEFP